MRALVILAIAAACATAPKPSAGPPPLADKDPAAVFARYIESLPRTFKMRHQVESRFGERDEVMSGFLVGERPDRFWVRALGPLNVTLFDVKVRGNDIVVDAKLDQITDPNAPRYLADDIRRIYFIDCPKDAKTERQGADTVAVCDLHGVGDDRLVTTVSPGGVVLEKCFYKDEAQSVCVSYTDYQDHGGTWLAHRIELTGVAAPYSLVIALEKAELNVEVFGDG